MIILTICIQTTNDLWKISPCIPEETDEFANHNDIIHFRGG